MHDLYRSLAASLARDSIRCHFQTRGQMVISRQAGPVWPGRGNSFWVTHIGGRWHLFTWSPIGYRVPDTADIEALCRTCMEYGDSAMGEAPPRIVQAFGLVELSEAECETIYREMKGSD